MKADVSKRFFLVNGTSIKCFTYMGYFKHLLRLLHCNYVLSDIFQWNYNALKSTYNALNNINDEEIASICEDAVALFDDNINDVLDILSELGGNDDE